MTTIETMTEAAKKLINERLDMISDDGLKYLLLKYFENRVPKYFWLTAASQTGNNHPIFAKSLSGLVRHTCAAFDLAIELKRSEVYGLSTSEWNVILAALLIHDTFKLGYEDKAKTMYAHPSIAADEFYDYYINEFQNTSDCSYSGILDICSAVETHQGKWGRKEPDSITDRIVHICDLLASKTVMEQFYDIKESDVKSLT